MKCLLGRVDCQLRRRRNAKIVDCIPCAVSFAHDHGDAEDPRHDEVADPDPLRRRIAIIRDDLERKFPPATGDFVI